MNIAKENGTLEILCVNTESRNKIEQAKPTYDHNYETGGVVSLRKG